MNFALSVPINSVSFGQVSIALLREFYKLKLEPSIFPIGQPDVSSQKIDPDFGVWINRCISKSLSSHSRNTPIFRLWHIEQSLESFSNKQVLLTFYELDNPTEQELNIVKNNTKVLVTNKYAKQIFEDYGSNNVDYIPLGFDSSNFSVKNKKYFSDDRIVFNVVGKFEKRKQHEKMIRSWIRKYGNNPKYHLQCAIYNPFFKPEENENIVKNLLGGRSFFNVQFIGYMQQNELYNDFLNSGNIVLGMGTEGYGLPEMHSVALGKHSVILNAAGYKSWANADNSIIINPNGKEPVYDNIFFVKGRHINQGNIFTFSEDEFLDGCDRAISRVNKDPVNQEGLKLQTELTYEKTASAILEHFKNI